LQKLHHKNDVMAAILRQNTHHTPAYWFSREQRDEANWYIYMGMIWRPWWTEATGQIWPGCGGFRRH